MKYEAKMKTKSYSINKPLLYYWDQDPNSMRLPVFLFAFLEKWLGQIIFNFLSKVWCGVTVGYRHMLIWIAEKNIFALRAKTMGDGMYGEELLGKKFGKSLILKKITGEFKSSTFFPAVVMIILENIVNSKSKKKNGQKGLLAVFFFCDFSIQSKSQGLTTLHNVT